MASRAILILSLCATLGILAPACKATEFVLYSNPATVLVPGQNFSYDMTPIGLPYGPADLVMRKDCNLVSHYKGEFAWASNTSGAADYCYLAVSNYGAAVIKGNYHYPVWTSPITSNISGDYVLILQWNGGLATYGPSIWSSTNKAEFGSIEIKNETKDYVVYSYSVLPIGPIATYKDFHLVLEDSCNLVLRRTDSGKVLWQTNKYSDSHDCFVTLDGNGELFVKHRRREILWRSNSRSTPGLYVFVLRYDARLVIYGSQIWTTKPFW
ncbi:mannose-specific lectin CEA-like [Dioscorea cayenensis subsp. rotundata]|uniref:Mannose-specific lectin CEA-like n=1 Tax=Dioscorea cayennensis subsp. rotundata TaxID=55577 RepID=A0AB40D0P9_DIOCR|nr:mannose-specific lectin CEA-like [Dioscorea cayenensis subsp. rotundata]